MNSRKFLAEVKRCNVSKVVVGYAVMSQRLATVTKRT